MSVLFFLKHFCKVLYTCTLRKVKEKKTVTCPSPSMPPTFIYLIPVYLSFLPNTEKCTYLFGCDFKSISKESADLTVAFRL